MHALRANKTCWHFAHLRFSRALTTVHELPQCGQTTGANGGGAGESLRGLPEHGFGGGMPIERGAGWSLFQA